MQKLTPMESIRAYCTQCLGMKQFNTDQVKDCQGDQSLGGPCVFFPYRMGKRPPVKVFRKFCLECMDGSAEGVRECPTEDCPCHPYRFGTNPAKRGQGASAEQMKKVRGSMKNAPESIFSTATVCVPL